MQEKPGESFLRQLQSNAVCLTSSSRSVGFRDPFGSCMQGLSPILLAQARNIAALLFGWCCRIRFDNHSQQRSILYLNQPQQRSCQATWICRRVYLQTKTPSCRVFASNPQPHNVHLHQPRCVPFAYHVPVNTLLIHYLCSHTPHVIKVTM